MSGLLQKVDLIVLREQIKKMKSACEYATNTTRIINKVQKKLQGQDGQRAVRIKNALHEQDKRSQELSSDLTNLKDGLSWVENLMYYADQEAARQLGAEDTGEWDSNRREFEETREKLHRNSSTKTNEDPVILILNGGNYVPDGTIPRADDGAPNQRDTGRVVVSENLKHFENNTYSNFHVLKNFKPEYVQEQQWTNNCTTTSEAIATSIKYDRWTNQFDMEWVSGKGASWRECNRVDGSENWTAAQKLSQIYEFLRVGEPVIVSCDPTGSRTSPHTVTAIGIRNGADPSNLTYADFLVADPADGTVKTLQELLENNLTIDRNGWSLKTIR